MEHGLLILLGAIFVNNVVLTRFLGLCPFMGVSRQQNSALGMGLATTFVLTISAVLSHLVHHYMLLPLDAVYLRTVAFIVVIAAAVQLTELVIRRFSPLLHRVLGLYLPLITTNCAVLGIALLSTFEQSTLLEATLYGVGAALGFTLVLWLFASIRERLDGADVPLPFRGNPVALITAGIMSLAFMGFH